MLDASLSSSSPSTPPEHNLEAYNPRFRAATCSSDTFKWLASGFKLSSGRSSVCEVIWCWGNFTPFDTLAGYTGASMVTPWLIQHFIWSWQLSCLDSWCWPCWCCSATFAADWLVRCLWADLAGFNGRWLLVWRNGKSSCHLGLILYLVIISIC